MQTDTQDLDAILAKMFIANVALGFGVTNTAVFTKKKVPAHLCYVRQSAMYLMHVVCQYSYGRVGKAFKLHPSTVTYACQTIENFRDDPVFDETLIHLEACIQSTLSHFTRNQFTNNR